MRSRAAMGPHLAAALLLAAPACDESTPDGPQPAQVTPGVGAGDRAVDIEIMGSGFSPMVKVDYNDRRRSVVSTAFAARLGVHPLMQVRFQDPTRLTARVPAGLPPGSHDLTVVDPRGRRGVLQDAYLVQAVTVDGGPPDARADGGPDDAGIDLPPADGAPAKSVATLAGTGQPGFQDDLAGAARFFNPRGVAVSGNRVLVADYANHRVRVIEAGKVSTLAGNGTQGYADGTATAASFSFPAAVAVDSAGAAYVADSANHVIRKIEGGVVTTLAGDGTQGFADGPAAAARFNSPGGIAEDNGAVYVADTDNHRIRMIKNGLVTTIAGEGSAGFADGPVATARFSSPVGLAISGITIHVADSGNHRIRSIAGGTVTTVAGIGTSGNTDGPALSAASFTGPTDVAADGATLYIADRGSHRIRTCAQGVVATLAGSYLGYNDGPLSGAQFYYPSGLALDSTHIYVADQSNHRVRTIER